MSLWPAGELQAALSVLSMGSRSSAQLRLLAGFLKRVKFFQHYSEQVLVRMSETLLVRKLSPGEVVCRYGEEDRSLFLVLEGEVAVWVPGLESGGFVIAKLGPGNTFGEMVLAKEHPRGSSVAAIHEATVCVLKKPDLEYVVQIASKQELDDKVAFLRTAPLFEKLSRQGLTRLAQYFREGSYVRGDYLYREGESANEVFLIVTGEVEFVKSHSISEREGVDIDTLIGPRTSVREPLPVRRLLSRKSKVRKNDFRLCVKGAKEMFGEEEIISDVPRANSAFIRSPHASLLVMSRSDFTRRMQHPEIWSKIHSLNELKQVWANGRIDDLNETEAFKQDLDKPEIPPKPVIKRITKHSISPPQEKKPVVLRIDEEIDELYGKVFSTDLMEQNYGPRTVKSAKGVEFTNSVLRKLEMTKPDSRVQLRKPRIRSSKRHSPPPNFHAVPSTDITSRYREQRAEYSQENRLGSYDAEQLRMRRQHMFALEKAKQSLSPSKHNLFRRRSKGELSESPGRKSTRM